MKIKSKKILSTILGIALATSMFGAMSVSAAGTVSVGIASDLAEVVEGTDVVISGSILSFPTAVVDGIVAYSVQVTYDASKFTYVSSSASLNGVLEASAAAGVLSLVYIDSYLGAGVPPTANPLTSGLFTATFTANPLAVGTSGAFVIAGIDGTDDFADNSAAYPDWKVPATYTTPSVTVDIISAAPSYILGDIDGDEYITTADAVMAFNYDLELITLDETQMLAADVDKDGYVTTADAAMIFNYDLELISSFE